MCLFVLQEVLQPEVSLLKWNGRRNVAQSFGLPSTNFAVAERRMLHLSRLTQIVLAFTISAPK